MSFIGTSAFGLRIPIIKEGDMETQGTTTRRYTDLLGSLMDLISGSGDKRTTIVVVQDYFKNYLMD